MIFGYVASSRNGISVLRWNSHFFIGPQGALKCLRWLLFVKNEQMEKMQSC